MVRLVTSLRLPMVIKKIHYKSYGILSTVVIVGAAATRDVLKSFYCFFTATYRSISTAL